MTNEETTKILTLLRLSYPTYMDKIEPDTLSAMGEMWQKMFADDAYNLVELATQKHISTSKYFPSIAEIRAQMARLMRPDLIPPEQAWALVHEYYCVYNHDSLQLPELIFDVADPESWFFKEHLNDGLGRKQFLEQYKPIYEKEFEKACLPKVIRDRIDKGNNYLGAPTIKQIAEIKDAAYKEKHKYDFLFDSSDTSNQNNEQYADDVYYQKAMQTRAKYANL